jgi:aldehyde dehydrogenase (NAD(P)+)
MTATEQYLGPSSGPIPAPAFEARPESSRPDLDRALERLKSHAREFARAAIGDKVAWLREIAARTAESASDAVAAACRAKGLDPDSPLAGEEWLAGPAVTLRNLRLLAESLEQIAATGTPRIAPAAVRERPEGGVRVRVTPRDALDKALFGGFVCETWLGAPVTAASLTEHQASFYKQREPEGGVSLVLGAGNVASIPPMDLLYKMFVEGRTCILKMNPVNEYLGPFIERAFKPLCDRGYLVVAYGGGDVGAYLCSHALVDDIHITGSDKTHDLIVWGPPGPERDRRKREGDPVLKKRITSELGNVSPVMVAPGPYSADELELVAFNIAGAITNNASFNCNAAKMLIVPAGWDRKDALLDAIGRALSLVPPRKAYYPGAQQRFELLTAGRERTKRFGDAAAGSLPWTIVEGLDASNANERNFFTEPFCAVLSQTELGSTDPAEFLAAAVDFANARLWGTLSATLFVHPSIEADPTLAPAVERAIRELRYGSVAVNHWPAMVYALGAPPWGGHPSATLADIQSGIGWVHNTPMLEHIEKAVLRGPLKAFPKPAWFPGHKTLRDVGRKMVSLEAAPSWLKVPGLALSALRA